MRSKLTTTVFLVLSYASPLYHLAPQVENPWSKLYRVYNNQNLNIKNKRA